MEKIADQLASAERKKENKEEKRGKEKRGKEKTGKEKKRLPMELSSFFCDYTSIPHGSATSLLKSFDFCCVTCVVIALWVLFE